MIMLMTAITLGSAALLARSRYPRVALATAIVALFCLIIIAGNPPGHQNPL